MTLREKIWLNWRYLRGDTPWEHDFSPPELTRCLADCAPRRVLDLGCGTGTHALTLARAGCQVVGVDFAWLAIRRARARARRAGLPVQFVLDDVTRLKRVSGLFDLALDIGCFHALGESKSRYLRRLDALLQPGGYWLLYGFREGARQDGVGLRKQDFINLPSGWRLLWRREGHHPRGLPTDWLLFQKTSV